MLGGGPNTPHGSKPSDWVLAGVGRVLIPEGVPAPARGPAARFVFLQGLECFRFLTLKPHDASW